MPSCPGVKGRGDGQVGPRRLRGGQGDTWVCGEERGFLCVTRSTGRVAVPCSERAKWFDTKRTERKRWEYRLISHARRRLVIQLRGADGRPRDKVTVSNAVKGDEVESKVDGGGAARSGCIRNAPDAGGQVRVRKSSAGARIVIAGRAGRGVAIDVMSRVDVLACLQGPYHKSPSDCSC